MSTAQTGWLVGAYSLPALFFTLPFGVLGDLWGKKRVLLFGLLLYGLSGLATIWATSFVQLVTMRTLQGIGYTAVVPLTVSLIAEIVPGEAQIMAQGYRVVFMSGAEFILLILASVLLTIFGHWQSAFWLFTLPLVIAFWAWRTLPSDRLPQHGRLRTPRGQYMGDMLRNLTDGTLASLMTAGFVRWFIKYAFYSYMPSYLAQQLHAGEASIGLVVALPGVVGALAASQAGRISTERSARIGVVLSIVGMGAALAVTPWVHSLVWVLMAAFGLGIADGLSGTLINGLVGFLPAASVRASVVAASGFFRNLGKAISPMAVGFLVAWLGIAFGFTIVGLSGLLSPAYLFPLWVHRMVRPKTG